MSVAVVVDSNSQLPGELAERYEISVVPLVVTVDGRERREGVDITVDDFYEAWSGGRVPEVTTSQPPPGAFVDVYQRLVADGAAEILSIHLTESMSGTVNSARVAARELDVPIRVVDSNTASFGISCCAWAAAEALADGADVDAAAEIASRLGAALRTSFVAGIPALVDRSGRAGGVDVTGAAADGVPVLAMAGGSLVVLETVSDVSAAVDVMAADALAWPAASGAGRRVAVGTSDASSRPVAAALVERLSDAGGVADLVEYRIGPSVGAHTGPGTAGLFCF